MIKFQKLREEMSADVGKTVSITIVLLAIEEENRGFRKCPLDFFDDERRQYGFPYKASMRLSAQTST